VPNWGDRVAFSNARKKPDWEASWAWLMANSKAKGAIIPKSGSSYEDFTEVYWAKADILLPTHNLTESLGVLMDSLGYEVDMERLLSMRPLNTGRPRGK
jgi:hypothetical protein